VTRAPLRVALYGGAFDPLHNGHLAAIAGILKSGAADRVVVVPCGDRPDKPQASLGEHRLAMTRLGVEGCFAGDERVTVSDAQVAGHAGYATVDLLSHFAKELPGEELLVVIGPELLADLPSWRDPERLRNIAHLLVVRRPGVTCQEPPPGWRITPLTAPYEGEVEASSTELRQRLRQGRPTDGLVPTAVREYCIRHSLYR